MKKIIKNKDILDRKKQLSTLLAASIALSSLAGCSKANNNNNTPTSTSSTYTTPVTTTVTETGETTLALDTTTDTVIACNEYIENARELATALYNSDKEYYDLHQFSEKDIENAYYVINGKYYYDENDDGTYELLMTRAELDRAYDVIRGAIASPELFELLQKYNDLENGIISYDQYMEAVNATVLRDSSVSLSNLIEKKSSNEHIIQLADDYSANLYRVQADLKNGVSPEKNLKEFFDEMYAAESGDSIKYNKAINLMRNNSANDGLGLVVALIAKTNADMLNTVTNGIFVTAYNGDEVQIGYTYLDNNLLVRYQRGEILTDEEMERALEKEEKAYQTAYYLYICDKINKINSTYDNSIVYSFDTETTESTQYTQKEKVKKYTI